MDALSNFAVVGFGLGTAVFIRAMIGPSRMAIFLAGLTIGFLWGVNA